MVIPRQIILVVEDEPLLRIGGACLAEAAGFEAVEAGNADEAIALLNRRSDICAVFTDIEMPGSMDGIRLAAIIRGRWPHIRIIFTSGHFDADELDLPEHSLFFPKPYRENELKAAFRNIAARTC